MPEKNERPVIAVDIDDVLFPFVSGIAEYHNDLKGTNLSPKDFTSYNFAEVWGGSESEANDIVDGFVRAENLYLQPVEGAKEALIRLNHDYNVVLVTARNQAFEAATVAWLRRHLPELFQHVVFAGNQYDGRPHRAKGVICNELNAQLLIDDHPRNIASAVECGVDGVLFGTHAWSVLDSSLDSVKACVDWPAVIEYIYHEWRQ